MTDNAFAQLRRHLLVIDPCLGTNASARLKPLALVYRRWLRQLVRVAGCADLDSLTAALQGGDQLLNAIEHSHQQQTLAGIVRIRTAFAGVETVIDQMSLSEPGQEPAPDALLDIPTEGLLARLLQRPARSAPVPVRRPVMARAAAGRAASRPAKKVGRVAARTPLKKAA